MIFPCLSFLQVSSSTAQVIQWLVNLITASQLLVYAFIGIIYIFFHRALKAQGLDRRTLYRGWCQPYLNLFGLIFVIIIIVLQGYTTFLPGRWSVADFFISYAMVYVYIILYFGYKLIVRTKLVRPEDADLVWDKPVIDSYEASIDPPLGLWEDIWKTVLGFTHKIRGLGKQNSTLDS